MDSFLLSEQEEMQTPMLPLRSAILGAKYGFSSIPDEYVNGLIYKEQLEEVVNGMIGLAK